MSTSFFLGLKCFIRQSNCYIELPAYSFAHAKVKKSILNPKILEFVGDIGIILNVFQSCSPKILEMQHSYEPLGSAFLMF